MSVQQPRRFWPCALINAADLGATIERQSKVNRTLTTDQEQQNKNKRSRTIEQQNNKTTNQEQQSNNRGNNDHD